MIVILQALNNGLLVDPHDSKAIADALLKLVADKNLWHECQRNGWRNIHLFSWPEHCRTYLTRVAACRMRHPHWQMDTPVDEISMEESLGEESLKDVQDLSLQLSFDGERNWLNSGVDQHELEKIAAVDAKCDLELQEQVKNILKQIKRYPNKKVEKEERNVIYSYPLLGRRRRLFVIAVDSYDEKGFPDKTMVRVIKQVLKGVRSDSQLARISGFALSTAMPVLETLEVLRSGKIQITDFDTLICSSGSEIYYPGTYNTFSDDRFKFDPDYMTHIEYRWGYHGVKNSLMKLMNSSSSSSHDMIREDVKSSNPHCISFLVKQDASKLKAVDDLRQKVRMRGLRCHLMYCRNFSRLHVVPLLASRSQALRYLFVRWGLNVANMYVILGDKGDTDREEMVAGCHKTIILKGVVQQKDFLTSERYWSESCKKEDMIPIGHDNPFIVCTGTGGVPNSDQILNALQQVSRSASLMS